MKMARHAVVLAMIVIGLVLALAVAYYVHGSLEELPGPEDHEKVRTVAGLIAVVLIAAQAILWSVLRRLGKARRSPGAAV
jgi:di/tricarboxylate transporter